MSSNSIVVRFVNPDNGQDESMILHINLSMYDRINYIVQFIKESLIASYVLPRTLLSIDGLDETETDDFCKFTEEEIISEYHHTIYNESKINELTKKLTSINDTFNKLSNLGLTIGNQQTIQQAIGYLDDERTHIRSELDFFRNQM